MTSSVQSRYSSVHLDGLSRAFWLPPNGHRNGIDDEAWIPVLDLGGAVAADDLLATFARHRMAAYTARIHEPRPDAYRVWVGSSCYGSAVDLLVQILPEFLARYGEAVIR